MDIARGVAILMVINWHIINFKDCWTNAWVMPIFFFIMGFFYKYEPSFRNLIIKKFKTLLIPMILWSVPMFVYDAFSLPPSDLLFLVVHPFKSVYSVSWFLICTFFCYVFYNLLNFIFRKQIVYITLASFTLSYISYTLSQNIVIFGHRFLLPFYMSTSVTCMAFLSIGQLTKRLKDKNLIVTFAKGNKSAPFLYILFLTFIVMTIWGGQLMGYHWCAYASNLLYGQTYFITIGFAILSCYSILMVSVILYRVWSISSLLIFCGKHSLLLLMVHPYIKNILSLMIDKDILIFLLTIGFSICSSYIISKYIPFLEGRFANLH